MPDILATSDGAITTLTLNRPAAFNALSEAMLDALQRWNALAKQLSALPQFSGVIVQSWEEFKEARP